MDLEPGNLAYFIDAGRALVATNDLANAKKVADSAQKIATWPRDRVMAAKFQKTVNSKMNASSDEDRSATAADPATASGEGVPAGPAPPSEKEGQITELICGHPPSVMFTLKAGDEQFLFHVKDIAKIKVVDAGDSADSTTCGKWKDRKAMVEFSETADGPAFGEVSSIAFK